MSNLLDHICCPVCFNFIKAEVFRALKTEAPDTNSTLSDSEVESHVKLSFESQVGRFARDTVVLTVVCLDEKEREDFLFTV